MKLDDSETGWAVKVLQYRSVAFVTYKSELHAQFAKEAMACQSLDNDEILNVRWLTAKINIYLAAVCRQLGIPSSMVSP